MAKITKPDRRDLAGPPPSRRSGRPSAFPSLGPDWSADEGSGLVGGPDPRPPDGRTSGCSGNLGLLLGGGAGKPMPPPLSLGPAHWWGQAGVPLQPQSGGQCRDARAGLSRAPRTLPRARPHSSPPHGSAPGACSHPGGVPNHLAGMMSQPCGFRACPPPSPLRRRRPKTIFSFLGGGAAQLDPAPEWLRRQPHGGGGGSELLPPRPPHPDEVPSRPAPTVRREAPRRKFPL